MPPDLRAVDLRAVVLRVDDLREALRARVVLAAFLPPMARVLSRLPRAPTRDLPSRSC